MPLHCSKQTSLFDTLQQQANQEVVLIMPKKAQISYEAPEMLRQPC